MVSIPWHCNLLNLILYEDLVEYIGEILHTCFELQVSHIECCSLAQTRLLEMYYIRYLIKGILRYGVRDARNRNRISLTLSLPGMLPNHVVDAISARARDEREAEEKREMRVEALPERRRCGIQASEEYSPDRMIPSLYQLDHFQRTSLRHIGWELTNIMADCAMHMSNIFTGASEAHESSINT